MSEPNLLTMKEQLAKWREEAELELSLCPKCKTQLEATMAGLYCRVCGKLR